MSHKCANRKVIKNVYYTGAVQKWLFHLLGRGGGWNESWPTSNTMKAHTNGSISRQYYFDRNYFQLLLGLRSFQNQSFKSQLFSSSPKKNIPNWNYGLTSGIQINFRIEIPKFHNLLARWKGRWKNLTFKTLIFENFWGPEVSGSKLYQKNIGAKLTHWHMPS